MARRRRPGARAAGRPARGVDGGLAAGRRRDRLLLQDQPHDGVPARLRRRRRRRRGRVRRGVRAGARRRRHRRARGSRVNGPAKPDALLARAAADGALVIADSAPELERLALAGVARAGLRVGLPGPEGTPSRFGIAPARGRRRRPPRPRSRPDARGAARPSRLDRLHRRSSAPTAAGTLAASVRVGWAKAPAVHAQAASMLAGLAAELGGVDAIDIGGGIPAAPSPAADAHAAAVADALRAAGFAGRLMLEPGRALVADAVDLACTVVAVKTLADGSTCAVLDAGTNLLPGALWAWPRLEALAPRRGRRRHADARRRPAVPEHRRRRAGRRARRARRRRRADRARGRRLPAGPVDAVRRPAPGRRRARRRRRGACIAGARSLQT